MKVVAKVCWDGVEGRAQLLETELLTDGCGHEVSHDYADIHEETDLLVGKDVCVCVLKNINGRTCCWRRKWLLCSCAQHCNIVLRGRETTNETQILKHATF
jgi:hypothetical protein